MKLHFRVRNKAEQIILRKLNFLFRLIKITKNFFYYKKFEKLLKNKLKLNLYLTKMQ